MFVGLHGFDAGDGKIRLCRLIMYKLLLWVLVDIKSSAVEF